jgi:hypothetical protein
MTREKAATERVASAPPPCSHVEALLDDALADTFPASDPVAIACEDRPAAKPESARRAAGRDQPAGTIL